MANMGQPGAAQQAGVVKKKGKQSVEGKGEVWAEEETAVFLAMRGDYKTPDGRQFLFWLFVNVALLVVVLFAGQTDTA